ncbi:hypothetical protein GCM10008961_20850 [Deinococcus knuensis]|uniref:Uncharacterized protein n=1 Tax=Deinococcus knuensis TaxID=1837380 RepID=A0ABQ2SHR8_9DEIO|nr:hypothetical protein GCM10008961_20850 [Deinococcus knuensis]
MNPSDLPWGGGRELITGSPQGELAAKPTEGFARDVGVYVPMTFSLTGYPPPPCAVPRSRVTVCW